ncbi:uncharacterized protein LOC116373976 [Oncorhynchus kisutch]|uniref:uncharacterized protein LOC116373976 n=1 Tax=Oncorhynchus kisutch TaxID=8019 RepID=UPI0012DF191A|nr:uncharacterized protein LOC116373976 [Oncorhynchus kisutch]
MEAAGNQLMSKNTYFVNTTTSWHNWGRLWKRFNISNIFERCCLQLTEDTITSRPSPFSNLPWSATPICPSWKSTPSSTFRTRLELLQQRSKVATVISLLTGRALEWASAVRERGAGFGPVVSGPLADAVLPPPDLEGAPAYAVRSPKVMGVGSSTWWTGRGMAQRSHVFRWRTFWIPTSSVIFIFADRPTPRVVPVAGAVSRVLSRLLPLLPSSGRCRQFTNHRSWEASRASALHH